MQPAFSLSKPGCFASPLCCARLSVICSSCNFVDECEVTSEARAMALRERFGIDASMLTPLGRAAVKKDKKKAKQEAVETVEETTLIEPRPVTDPNELLNRIAHSQLDRLKESGVDLMDLGGDFVLPVRGVPEFLRMALQRLEKGAIHTPALAFSYQHDLAWSDKKAASHAEIASRMLIRCGRAERDRRATDRILLKRY